MTLRKPMNDETFLKSAYIQEGMCPSPGVIVVCATIGDDEDDPQSCIGIRRDGNWIELAFDGDACLSTDTDESGAGYALGESGALVKFDWRAVSQDALDDSGELIENPEAEELGPLRRLRVLGKDVVCAGSVGQAYVLMNDRFKKLPQLLVDGEAPTIEDLAGNSAKDLVAVTSDGYVAHFDGRRWGVLDFPSNASFTSICKTRAGHYAVVGKNGTVVVGTLNAWALVPIEDDVDYWGIAVDDQRLYAASLDGIDEITPTGATEIAIADRDDLYFTVLRSCADGVYSFANHSIGRVSGGIWATLVK